MGQYYKTVNIDRKEFIQSQSFLKLMENAWLKNEYVQSVEGMLIPERQWYGDRIVWAGDYGDNRLFVPREDYKEGVKRMREENQYYRDHPEEEVKYNLYDWADHFAKELIPEWRDMMKAGYFFIINDDLKEYVDKRDCPADKDGWIVHPLPLLTASGNGRGGGDYHGEGMEHVGAWAGHHIRVEKEPPEDYTLITPNFKE